MIKRIVIQAFVGLAFISKTFGQDHVTSYQVELQQKTPQSPNSASLGKYLDFDVNMATGVPTIQIPLYTFKTGNISVPIVLTYHAGGVKVNEKAGWVGLNWNLSPGGSVIKKTNGLDDIYLTTGTSSGTPNQDYLHPNYSNIPFNPGYWNMTDAVDGFINNGWPESALDSNLRFMGRILVGQNDGEADDFLYSCPGGSGKFYYNQKLGKFQTNKTNGWVVYGDTTGIGLVATNGLAYGFGQREHTVNPLYQRALSTQQNFITAWHLTSIADNANNTGVGFEYENTYTTDVDNGITESNDYTMGSSLNLYANRTDVIKRTGDNYTLKKIQSPEGTINFIKDTATRQDGAGPKALKEIQIYNRDSVLLKKFVFSYYYTTANSGCGGIYGADPKRLILQSVQEINYDESGTGTTKPPYYFNYDTTVKLPCRLAYSQDKWGYYNGKSSNTTSIPKNPYFTYFSYTGGADRSVDSNYAKAQILNEIVYSTGGKANFEYQSNRLNDTTLIGGLRVKKITYYDSVAKSSIITEYSYPGLYTYWNPVFWYLLNNCSDFYLYNNQYNFTFTPLLRVEGEPTAPNFVNQGAPGFYNAVEKKQKSSSGDLYSKHYFMEYYEAGASYSNIMGVPRPHVPQIIDIVERKKEIYKKESNGSYTLIQKDSTDYGRLENALDYIWNVKGAWNFNQEFFCQWPGGDPFIYAVGYMIFNISPSIEATKIYPSQIVKGGQTTDQITTNGNLRLSSYYGYDHRNANLTVTQSVDSKGDTTIVKIKYAADYIRTGSSTGMNHQIDTLHDYNYLAAPIEVVTLLKKKDSTNSILKDATFYEYEDLKVKKIYKVYENIPYSSFMNSYNDSAGFYKDALYTLVQEITAFDNVRNPLTVVSNGNKESFVWDGEDMTAKISNAGYEVTAFTSFESSQKGRWAYTGTVVDTPAITGKKAYILTSNNVTISSISNIPYVVSYWSKNGAYNVNSTSYITGRTVNGWTYYEHAVTPSSGAVTVSGSGLIDELRLYPKGAQMTTFTYRHLRGISSVCDISNRIMYYDYGGGEQLKAIRDEDGRIVKRFDYKYKGGYQD